MSIIGELIRYGVFLDGDGVTFKGDVRDHKLGFTAFNSALAISGKVVLADGQNGFIAARASSAAMLSSFNSGGTLYRMSTVGKTDIVNSASAGCLTLIKRGTQVVLTNHILDDAETNALVITF